MRRYTFALSWGRKIFFGLGWLFISLLALNYLQSFTPPQSALGWIYYFSTFIGHYGLMTMVLYFGLYLPIVYLFPSYYLARFWSLILVLCTSLYIFFDSIVFNQYRFHLNGFIFDLVDGGSLGSVLNFQSITYVILAIGIIVFSLIFWLRGERVWRVMQGRFSNPNKNWYLYFIIFALIVSHGIHIYGRATGSRAIASIAGLFPLHYPASANSFLESKGLVSAHESSPQNEMDDFSYPIKPLECKESNNKNILMIVIDGLKEQELSPFVTPTIAHLTSHGTYFTNHYSGSTNREGTLFSLSYSLPATYFAAAKASQKPSVLASELKTRQYDTFDPAGFLDLSSTPSSITDQKLTEDWKNWLKEHHELRREQPFFGFLLYTSANFSGPVADDHKIAVNSIDDLINGVLFDLYRKGLNDETIIMVMGGHDVNPSARSPLVVVWPEKDSSRVSNLSSNYDVVPTLMQELWSCKTKTQNYSYGQNLFELEAKDWLLVTGKNDYSIVDFNQNLITTINPAGFYKVEDFSFAQKEKDQARKELVFSVLKDLVRFNKKR